jgi:hypothetical protein
MWRHASRFSRFQVRLGLLIGIVARKDCLEFFLVSGKFKAYPRMRTGAHLLYGRRVQ